MELIFSSIQSSVRPFCLFVRPSIHPSVLLSVNLIFFICSFTRSLFRLSVGQSLRILGDPGAASWGDEIFTSESLQQERESPWAFTLTERVPGAFEMPLADWPENRDSSGVVSISSRVKVPMTSFPAFTPLFV